MRSTLFLLVIALMLTGCRMYGGYGSEAALAAEIERATSLLDGEQSRLQADREALRDNSAALAHSDEYLATMDA